ncbi:hypothetical protein CGCTS75_v004140 [Colletotrichum tropicale]|nr:hypothetical protein CGCTS75_v004140 [Colletotrichum tropicale]
MAESICKRLTSHIPSWPTEEALRALSMSSRSPPIASINIALRQASFLPQLNWTETFVNPPPIPLSHRKPVSHARCHLKTHKNNSPLVHAAGHMLMLMLVLITSHHVIPPSRPHPRNVSPSLRDASNHD